MKIDDDFKIEHRGFKIESNPFEGEIGDDDHVWVSIENVDVKVGYTKRGVIVELWAAHGEDDIPLKTSEVSFSEAEKEQVYEVTVRGVAARTYTVKARDQNEADKRARDLFDDDLVGFTTDEVFIYDCRREGT